MLGLRNGIFAIECRRVCSHFRHTFRVSVEGQSPCHDADITIDRNPSDLADQGSELIELRRRADRESDQRKPFPPNERNYIRLVRTGRIPYVPSCATPELADQLGTEHMLLAGQRY